ncbi:recombinase family protein [Helcobacillus massiliensis]|uniref:recombinase family protein n=1 Tax=Helcobacillus massiliensis TaxID=521392 RepID=UPI001622FB5E|nr:recombinase family protein [Helcobacillus massiliensis]
MRGKPEFNDNDLVVGYYRYSSSSQNEASIEQQRELVHRWAKAQGLQVVREYADAAKTGTNTERPEFQLMLRELPSIRPSYVAVWKNDRLGRDRMDLLKVKNAIRMAGAKLHYIEGFSPTDDPDSILVEGLSDAFAEYYSRQLSANIRRGVHFNAEKALANGRKIFGFAIGADKRYELDPQNAPVVEQMFADYAAGKSMQRICDEVNAAGVRTTNGFTFSPKTLNKMLKNRAYIGEYPYAGHVVPGGMPQIVDDEMFEQVQKMFAVNKRRGAKTKAELASMGDEAPDYWLTGRLFCERCGASMEGVSGTSKTGRKYRYYNCLNQRKKKCAAKAVRKDDIEQRVVEVVESFLDDTEMLASLAVDMAHHYRETHERGRDVLEALEARRRDVEGKLANFVKAISAGIFNESTAQAMAALEEQKKELDSAIQAEHVKATLFEDEASIGAFYQRFAHATMDTRETRELLFEYFIDKIFVGATTLTIASWFFDHGAEFTRADLDEMKETGEVLNVEFNTSPRGGAGGNRTRVR